MRKLQTLDVFAAMRLIQKSGLKEKFVPVIKKIAEDGTDAIDSGIIGILTLIEVFSEARCESLIYDWLAGPCELTSEEIAHMDLGQFTDTLEQLAAENDLSRFFTVLSKLASKKG